MVFKKIKNFFVFSFKATGKIKYFLKLHSMGRDNLVNISNKIFDEARKNNGNKKNNNYIFFHT